MTLREQRAIVYPPEYTIWEEHFFGKNPYKQLTIVALLFGIALIPYVIRYTFTKRKENK